MADLDETIAAEISAEPDGMEPEGYHVDSGPLPFFLLITRPNGESVEIDLEENQWMKTYAEWMRGASRWYLTTKPTPQVPAHVWLAVNVRDGDQPYYTARHIVRIKGRNAGAQITAYGIGAKRIEGHTDRLWIMPNGIVCGGEDADAFGDAVIDSLGN